MIRDSSAWNAAMNYEGGGWGVSANVNAKASGETNTMSKEEIIEKNKNYQYTRFRHEVMKYAEFQVSESEVTIHEDILNRIKKIKDLMKANEDSDDKIKALL